MTKADVTAQEVQSFFYSQAFADGLRASFAILLPALAGLYFDRFDIGLAISLGAMCVSLTDAPGPFIHKRNGMLACAVFIFLVALVTGFARTSVFFMALEITVVCFFFSMFNVYGTRAAGVGNAAILMMILTMDRPVSTAPFIVTAFMILSGGVYYTALSLLLYKLQPYRVAKRALGDSILEIGNYLSIKADFYNVATDLAQDYKRMLGRQITVHEKQDAARELLFKSRQIVEENSLEGRRLVLTFVETIDLFENITATYFDYEQLRQQYVGTGILPKISSTLKKSAMQLRRIGVAIQSGGKLKAGFDYDAELIYLKKEIDALDGTGKPTRVLKRILVNIRRILTNIQTIVEYFETSELPKTSVDHSRFISHQAFSSKMFWDNISLKSSIFRHSIRVAVACLAGFIVAKFMAYGHHSYWILLTIAFILKPAYSLTKQRNIERILGTVAGAIIGILIFVFVHDSRVQFAFMVLFMIGTYTFMRMNYLRMVICTTPYVLLLFKFLGVGFVELAGERILDTVTGCAIAFFCSYVIFPSWEADQLKHHVSEMLRANINYLTKVADILGGTKVAVIDYKLARKAVYVASANLTAAFQRMLSEPKQKQASRKNMYRFVVQNHILFSNIASVATALINQKQKTYSGTLIHLVSQSCNKLYAALSFIDAEELNEPRKHSSPEKSREILPEEKSLKEQLEFIEKISSDIEKTVTLIREKSTL